MAFKKNFIHFVFLISFTASGFAHNQVSSFNKHSIGVNAAAGTYNAFTFKYEYRYEESRGIACALDALTLTFTPQLHEPAFGFAPRVSHPFYFADGLWYLNPGVAAFLGTIITKYSFLALKPFISSGLRANFSKSIAADLGLGLETTALTFPLAKRFRAVDFNFFVGLIFSF